MGYELRSFSFWKMEINNLPSREAVKEVRNLKMLGVWDTRTCTPCEWFFLPPHLRSIFVLTVQKRVWELCKTCLLFRPPAFHSALQTVKQNMWLFRQEADTGPRL